MSEFTLKSSERYTIVGKTGTGKTYLAVELLVKNFSCVVFYNPKWDEKDTGLPVVNSVEEVKQAFENDVYKLELRPLTNTREERRSEFNRLCRLMYSRGNCHLVVDELKALYKNHSDLVEWHDALLTRGRARNVGCTTITQRPTSIPMEAMSESENFFAFKLRLDSDVDRMVQLMGSEVEDLGDLPNWWFYYYRDGMDSPRKMKPIEV